MKLQYKSLIDKYLQVQQNLKNYCDQFLENCEINQLRNQIFELQINRDNLIEAKISNTIEHLLKDECSLITSNIEELKLKHKKMNINYQKFSTQDLEQKMACFLKKYNQQQLYSIANPRLFNVPALKILDLSYFCKLEQKIEADTKRQIQQMNQLYLGSQDGLNEKALWCKINYKSHLLMAFRSKNKGKHIFGAYSPCQWKYHLNNYVEDPTGTSFIFSKTHNEIYRLKEAEKKYAIHCDCNNGPTFGEGPALSIAGNFVEGHSKLGKSYQCEDDQASSNEHLFGGVVPNIDDCEIYELIFE